MYFGIFVVTAGFFLGYFFQNAGCGVCGGTTKLIPKFTTFTLYVPAHSRPSQVACTVMGCSAGIVYPIFVDIIVTGVLIALVGWYLTSKTQQ